MLFVCVDHQDILGMHLIHFILDGDRRVAFQHIKDLDRLMKMCGFHLLDLKIKRHYPAVIRHKIAHVKLHSCLPVTAHSTWTVSSNGFGLKRLH